jgi:replicative DNA helicase
VKDKAILRGIIGNARKIAIQASEPNANPDNIPTRLSIEVSRDVEINQVSTVIHNLNRNIEDGYPGIRPGYDVLSRTIRKISPGHLWIIGGYTSTGKSAILVDLICRIYRSIDNPGIAIFSTEMSCEQYLLRMLSNQTAIPTWAITENKMNPQQTEKLIQAQIFFSKRNLYLYDRLYKIEDIERMARMLKDRGLDIIAIDYLQNMWGEGTIYEKMSRLSPILQFLAKDLQITIIALSQVSNQFQRDKGQGGVFGYKGAGEIAASADLGIEIERDKAIKERMIFKVSKNRHGRTGEGVLEYVNGFTRFEEINEGNEE